MKTKLERKIEELKNMDSYDLAWEDKKDVKQLILRGEHKVIGNLCQGLWVGIDIIGLNSDYIIGYHYFYNSNGEIEFDLFKVKVEYNYNDGYDYFTTRKVKYSFGDFLRLENKVRNGKYVNMRK